MERCESEYCGKTFEKGSDKMAVKVAKKLGLPKESVDGMLKKLRSKESRATSKKECIKAHCNPDCKNTIFQAGKEIPSSVYMNASKKMKGKEKGVALLKSILTLTRKRMFGNKTNVLKNSFYNKLPANNVTRAKKQGALSGCTIKVLT
jgi:hypothetical protein